MKLRLTVYYYLAIVLLLLTSRFVHTITTTSPTPEFNPTVTDDGAELARAVRADCRLRHAPVCTHAHAHPNSNGDWDECAVVGDTLQCVHCVGVLSTIMSQSGSCGHLLVRALLVYVRAHSHWHYK